MRTYTGWGPRNQGRALEVDHPDLSDVVIVLLPGLEVFRTE